MKSDDIRKRFLEFFAARSHRVVRSSSLVPANDPTLLFANAGMNQFKDVFLGAEKRDYARACSSQKCVRAGGKHNDLEQVGRTARHHTFFEMLGNFSFGDYFKKEAIPFAWELITSPDWFGIPKDKLYVTIFEGVNNIPRDAEAYDCWRAVDVPADRIFEMGMKDNFWQMGETGPCGPCSEIHYDLGPAASEQGHADCKFPCDCGRYVELWNLVFMQFNRDESGKMTPLPRPSIDTGAGLERMATVLQGQLSNFDTDLFRPLIEEAAELANVEPPFRAARAGLKPGATSPNHENDVSLRIIADHARAATFLISDGVLPSNEGRGYVLRLIMRRALYHGQTLGLNEPFLFKMSGHVVDMMKSAYPELAEAAHHIAKAIKIEEERYAHTARVGLERLQRSQIILADGQRMTYEQAAATPAAFRANMLTQRRQRIWEDIVRDCPEAAKDAGVVHAWPQAIARLEQVGSLRLWVEVLRYGASSTHVKQAIDAYILRSPPLHAWGWVPGDVVFKLHDTFGLRPEFVDDVVTNQGLSVDYAGYKAEMDHQRERARSSWKAIAKSIAKPAFAELARANKTNFLGYETSGAVGCRVVGLVGADTDQLLNEASPKAGPIELDVILDQTPFYAEAGGQVGDTGLFRVKAEDVAVVTDTQSPVTGLIAHRIRFLSSRGLKVGDLVEAEIDAVRRDSTRRNHTATHLLHAALRTTLGPHVKQAGSLVAPDRLRFDFSHYAALGDQDLLDIEDLVNQHVLSNEEMHTEVMDLDTAINTGAMALFGEKYGDKVRVVSVGDGSYSKELCGGTHVHRTGDIGLFKVISEGSVAAGTRRIEALTGSGVLDYLRKASGTLALLGEALRAKPDELLQAAEKLTESEKKLRKQLEAQQLKQATSQAGDLLESAKEVKGVRVISTRVEVTDRAAMRQMVDNLRPRLNSGVIVLGSTADGKVSLIVAVTKDLTDRLDAGRIIKEAVAMVGGKGGGRKDLAEAGGTQPEKLDETLQAVPSIIEKML
ncbi:MAG TPA: alanine--tRNA ligase [Terriglobia bacterium]|nr:alanine--tRNA ligase [Terriglobia bacterium]